MAVAVPSSAFCVRLLPTTFCPSSVRSSLSSFNGAQLTLPFRPNSRCRHLTSTVIAQKEDFTIKKFQIPGFRPKREASGGERETENAGSEEAPGVSRRQAMAGAVAGILAAAGAGVGSSEAEADTGDFITTPSGLGYKDTSEGTGAEPVKGQLIKAHYTGRLETTGKVFDSSYNRGKPLTFRIGAGEVIKGWDQGILGAEGIPPMKAGGKRVLRIPAELGYGGRGAGCRGGVCAIPPNSVLIFDVEFVGKASG